MLQLSHGAQLVGQAGKDDEGKRVSPEHSTGGVGTEWHFKSTAHSAHLTVGCQLKESSDKHLRDGGGTMITRKCGLYPDINEAASKNCKQLLFLEKQPRAV